MQGVPVESRTWAVAKQSNTINLVYTGANYTPPVAGATAIPEPTTGTLLLVGLVGAYACRRRRI